MTANAHVLLFFSNILNFIIMQHNITILWKNFLKPSLAYLVNRRVHFSAVARAIIGGGAHIHIFVFTYHKKQLISKEINKAEHEYMNMCPPPPNYRSGYGTGPFCAQMWWLNAIMFLKAHTECRTFWRPKWTLSLLKFWATLPFHILHNLMSIDLRQVTVVF